MNPYTAQRGYTLVELIVSVAIFAIVMLVASAAFLQIIYLDRQARATNDAVSNLSYVMDSVERSIRTGTNYSCGGIGDCWGTPRSSFSFTDAENRSVTYSLITNNGKGQIQECISGTCSLLTDPRVNVTTFNFYVRGTVTKQNSDTVQPTAIIVTRGTVIPDSKSAPVQFVIESGATQRLIDL